MKIGKQHARFCTWRTTFVLWTFSLNNHRKKPKSQSLNYSHMCSAVVLVNALRISIFALSGHGNIFSLYILP